MVNWSSKEITVEVHRDPLAVKRARFEARRGVQLAIHGATRAGPAHLHVFDAYLLLPALELWVALPGPALVLPAKVTAHLRGRVVAKKCGGGLLPEWLLLGRHVLGGLPVVEINREEAVAVWLADRGDGAPNPNLIEVGEGWVGAWQG